MTHEISRAPNCQVENYTNGSTLTLRKYMLLNDEKKVPRLFVANFIVILEIFNILLNKNIREYSCRLIFRKELYHYIFSSLF